MGHYMIKPVLAAERAGETKCQDTAEIKAMPAW